MDTKISSRLKKISTLAVVIIIVLIIFGIYQSLTFHLIATDPPLSKISVVASTINFQFNKRLVQGVKVTASPSIISSYSVSGKNVVVSLDIPLKVGQSYSITLHNIRSVGGDTIISKTLLFKAKSVDNLPLTSAQNKVLLKKQQQYSNLINGNSFLQLLPYTGPNFEYRVSYTIIYNSQNNPIPVVQVTAPNQQAQNDALSWVASQGYTPQNIDIQEITGQP